MVLSSGSGKGSDERCMQKTRLGASDLTGWRNSQHPQPLRSNSHVIDSLSMTQPRCASMERGMLVTRRIPRFQAILMAVGRTFLFFRLRWLLAGFGLISSGELVESCWAANEAV